MRLIEQFNNSYIRDTNTLCWLWTGETSKNYGILWLGGSQIHAYKLSYFLHKGEIPSGMTVCHACDIPACVNPDHLWIGSSGDNIRDAYNKGIINNTGTNNGSSKLKECEVLEIVSLYKTGEYTHYMLADMYRVGKTIIGDILLGKKWNYLTKIIHILDTEYIIKPYDVNQSMLLLEKFNSSYIKNECWEWTGEILSTGYGAFYIGGTQYLAHRMSYSLFNDEIPKEIFVCHTCDNRSCVNPDHLWLGTQKDNMQDAKQKGVIPKGEDCKSSKLTEEKIIEMIHLYSTGNYSQKEVANLFGVSHSVISNLLHEKTWKHLDIDRSFRKSSGSSGNKNGTRLHPETVKRGENHPSTKISDTTVAEIKQLSNQFTQRELAKKFAVSQTQIGRIIRGETRK